MKNEKLSEILSYYENEKLYNFIDIVNNFKFYYGYSIEELEKLFYEYTVMEWHFIFRKLSNLNLINFNIIESEKLYYVYLKSLTNLSVKGNEIVTLINNLCVCGNVDLEDVGIYHYATILKGSDVKKILIVLFHIIKEFKEYLAKINLISTYCNSGYSEFSLNYGGDRIYPNSELFIFEDEYNKNLLDKTSLIVKRKKKI